MRKLTIEDVRDCFEKSGWTLLDDVYIKSGLALNVVCPNSHSTTISWNNFQRGQGCKFCAGNIKFDYEEVKQYFADQDCELLETNYVNSTTPIHFRCSCGTISNTTFGNFREGRRCQNCKSVKMSLRLRKTSTEIEEFCHKHGCQLVGISIQSKRTRMQYICKCGEPAEAYWTNFCRFPNCKKCGAAKISGANCYMWNPDREAVARNKKYRKICSNILGRALAIAGAAKSDNTYKLLGYTAQELQDHIQGHPNYAACVGKTWHVDHIFPIKAFMDASIFDLKLINALDNLRPLIGAENLSKADDYDKLEFDKWLNRGGL